MTDLSPRLALPTSGFRYLSVGAPVFARTKAITALLKTSPRGLPCCLRQLCIGFDREVLVNRSFTPPRLTNIRFSVPFSWGPSFCAYKSHHRSIKDIIPWPAVLSGTTLDRV